VRKYILMDMSELILNQFDQKRKGVITSAVQEMRIAKIIYSYYSEQPVKGGGVVAICIAWWYSSISIYRNRSRHWQRSF
jgi:hypothetical protein